ncbi:MAG: ferredoxin [Verrucomicrobia bacterium]|nr:ferredoxin [Verrucomicrobiota bacterium]
MTVKVDKEICTGCGLCVDTCHIFALDDGEAVAKVNPVPPESEDRCREAVHSCPVEAITIGN